MTEMRGPLGPAKVADVDPEVAEALIRTAALAADMEVLNHPAPISKVRDPDGGPQRETEAERTRRILEAGVLHLIEQGLLVVPDDFAARIDRPIPIERVRS